jgi:heme A synthase
MKTLRNLAFVTAGFAYAVIVLGFVVRITGSGMGCGDHWPVCNGQLIPALNSPEVIIEFGHRLAVLGLSVLVAATAVLAFVKRATAGVSGPGGLLRPALLAVGLLLVQSLLGALAVKLELPPHTVVLHLGTGLGLLATLFLTGMRAGVVDGSIAPAEHLSRGRGGVIGALILGTLVVLMGGMTATTGAFSSCLGFPLCNGQIWPSGGEGGLQHIHWTHRLLAYALFFHLIGVVVGLRKRGAPGRVERAAWIGLALGVAQVAAGAAMVLAYLPPTLRTVHAVLGTGVWLALVYLAWITAGTERATAAPSP